MQNKYRIAVLGIGGVGGFIGGKLAAAFSQSADVEIIFIARGNHAHAIKENGLKLITATEETMVRPDRVADVTEDIGPVNLLLCCTKTYDLENGVKAIAASITPATIVLPLLNGADNTERLQSLLPDVKVLYGCIYLVAKIIEPGVVQQKGDFYALHFGGDDYVKAELPGLLRLFEKAGVNAILEEDIKGKVWSKFSFISPVATYTSAHNISLGKILESQEHSTAITKLITELLSLARALNVELPADTIEKNFAVMARLPYETTSSMHADFAAHRPTELETLTGFVVKKAEERGMNLEGYSRMNELLNAK